MDLQDILRLAQSGARGFTTGLLGAPVDIANMAMGGVGGQKPVMGSEWIGDKLQNMGLLAAHANDLPNEITEFAGGLLNPGGGAAVGKGLLGGAKLAHIVFHGSPHTFDKFDMAKIGTGEGAQAYGHGLYFADSPSTAKYYHKAVQSATGKHYEWADRSGKTLDPFALAKTAENGDPQGMAASLLMQRSSVDEALDDVLRAPADAFGGGDAERKAIAEALLSMQRRGVAKRPSGGVYKVDIPDEAIGRMLDWDKPLSQQPQAVQDLVAKVQAERAATSGGRRPLQLSDITRDSQGAPVNLNSGGAIHQYLASPRYGGTQEQASAMLRSAGIPGIRYLDQGSRDWRVLGPQESTSGKWVVGKWPGGGKEQRYFDNEADARAYFNKNNTSNYVLFDDALAKIVGRE